MANDQSFLGRGWAFPPQFERDGVKMVEAERDIQESLRILLATTPKERVMLPEYGCGLHALVFDRIDATNQTIIKDTIRQAVIFFEPRIDLENIEIDTTNALEGRLDINLVYTVRSTNTRTNLVYPFYYLEATNVRSN